MLNPNDALAAIQRPSASLASTPARCRRSTLLAGAAGALGEALSHALLAAPDASGGSLGVLIRQPMTTPIRGLWDWCVPLAARAGAQPLPVAQWPLADWPPGTEAAVMCFEPMRAGSTREEVIWVPQPDEAWSLAKWLKGCGVKTLVVVLPLQPGKLPAALQQGLASMEEMRLAELGFEQLVLLRPAAAATRDVATSLRRSKLEALAQWMLGITRYMVPSAQQPLRSEQVAAFCTATLRALAQGERRGTWVAAPELIWQASQRPVNTPQAHQAQVLAQAVERWLDRV